MDMTVQITGTFEAILGQELAAGERATSTAVAAAGAGVKDDWRGQIVGAGLGSRLGNTIRQDLYPKHKFSLNAASMVYTKAPKIISAFERGAVVRSSAGFWLAIPTKAAPRGSRGAKITPAEWERRTGRRLRFVFRRGRAGLLIDDGTVARGARVMGRDGFSREARGFKNRSIVIFTLVPQAKLPKKLNLFAGVEAAAGRIPGLIVGAWR